MPSPVRVMLTMDCERVRDNPFYPAGPASWDESERNITAFAEIASAHGFRVTYFAVPEAIEAHAGLFKALILSGHEVGLHLHPNSFRYGVNEYLANLPIDVQLSLLSDARDSFDAAMGFRPTSFRPGHFSANAGTFRALTSLGFQRTSAGIPGRHLRETGGDWSTWPRHCHYVEAIFEVPVTVHYLRGTLLRLHGATYALSLARRRFVVEALRVAEGVFRGEAKFGTVQGRALVDLRIEEGSGGLLNEIITAEVDRMTDEPLPMLAAVTHSYVNFSSADGGSREHGMSRRRHVTRMLQRLAPGSGTFTSRTLSELQRDFDAQLSGLTPPAIAVGRTV
jgi:hypothetical protein